ncbi:hypothetical protein MMC22_007861 [Lobaria immixta]|nr:hypothetical protein [Lobaria immixta]
MGSIRLAIPYAWGCLLLDIYIFILPIAGIWNLQMSLKHKLGVMVVFMTGLIACIASSLSIYYRYLLHDDPLDYTYTDLPVLIMTIVEMCVGNCASCMPALANMLRHRTPRTNLPSRFSGTIAAVRSSKLRFKNSHSISHSNDTLRAIDPYMNMNSAESSEQIEHTKPMRTFISSGQPNEMINDGIHLNYVFKQEISDKRNKTDALVWVMREDQNREE